MGFRIFVLPKSQCQLLWTIVSGLELKSFRTARFVKLTTLSNTNDFLTLAGGIIITFTKEILNMIAG